MNKMKSYQCTMCSFIYHEALGWPLDGVVAGTRWKDISNDWVCPDCGAMKEDFNMIEM